MFTKNYEQQLLSWKKFRDTLEVSDNPFKDVVDFYKQAPKVSFCCDPWNQSSFPGPWQLLQENEYCDFGIVLGMCYSLQLTDRFSGSDFEIHISTNREKAETFYLLYIDNDTVIGYDDNIVSKETLPEAQYSQAIYAMNELH